MKKQIITFILIALNFNVLYSQEFKSGLILPKNQDDINSDKYCCILSPDKGFTLYNKPEGKKVGMLKKQITKDEQSRYNIFIFSDSGKRENFEHYEEIAYEVSALNFVNIKNGFVKLGGTKELWIKIWDIENQHFKTVFWKDFLLSENKKVLGYYAKDPGLNVRKEPDAQSEIIGSVRGDLFEIKLTNEFSGKWCKVKITKYKQHPCETDLEETENTESQYEGWIKILDDNDNPNIYSYTRGC